MAITKAGLKKQLHAMGIKTYRNKVTGGVFVKKSDVKKVLAKEKEMYKVFEILDDGRLELQTPDGYVFKAKIIDPKYKSSDFKENGVIEGDVEEIDADPKEHGGAWEIYTIDNIEIM